MSFFTRLPPQTKGRILVLLAGILWSTSGAFVKTSSLPGFAIAMYRSLFAGIGLLALVAITRAGIGWHWLMIPMTACFASMNYLFISSMTHTSAANTVFLQYTAPLWMFLGSVLWLKEPVDRRSLWSLIGGMAGIALLIGGHWNATPDQHLGIAEGLGSGVTYAGIAIFLRRLRGFDSRWLAALNHVSAGILLGFGLGAGIATGSMPAETIYPLPATGELLWMAAFGLAQMGLPYVLFGWGLRYVNPQEAGILTLIEPALAPIWAYLAAGEKPAGSTLIGGGVLLTMLLARYMPQRKTAGDGRP